MGVGRRGVYGREYGQSVQDDDSYLMHSILKYKVAIIIGSCFLHIL